MASGKRELAKQLLHGDEAAFKTRCACEVQSLAAGREDLEALADELTQYEIVTASELGGGVVPVDPREREARERAGRLACLLAERADTVIRVFCGIPKVLKGEGK
jgi:adenosyl cobinamide kinase/adenosyl cobinamide phosphate guanylyltransferase